MKVAFYPGCVSRGGCPELYPSAVKVAAQLGLELEELTDVGCNGAGVLSREVSDPINARTFAKACCELQFQRQRKGRSLR